VDQGATLVTEEAVVRAAALPEEMDHEETPDPTPLPMQRVAHKAVLAKVEHLPLEAHSLVAMHLVLY
jgi:hypothetical protein